MSTLDFGGKIKTLRLSKSMTQEQLAQRLRVSPQAVSKWENGVTLPDIQLLPELSILLGASIDALFSITDDKRMERIDNMLWDQRFLSREEFETEERFLKDKCLEPDAQARATLLLAELYCKRAREYRELASPLARKALELLPDYEKPPIRRSLRRKAACSRTGTLSIITEPSSFTRISSPVTRPSAGRTSGCWICSSPTAAARKRGLIWPRPTGWKRAIIPICTGA